MISSGPRTGYYGTHYHSPGRNGYGRSGQSRYLPLAVYSMPYYYPDLYADPGAAGNADMPPPAGYEPDPSQGLAAELASLHREVSEMRQMLQGPPPEEQQGPSAAMAQPPAPPSAPPAPPLVLVFRDGSRTEVRDFAVIGETFWDLSSRPTRKIALAQLNLEASIQATEARGAEFPALQTR